MAITAPSNFTCGKSTVYPGETITCTWTAASGDFDFYDISIAYHNAFRHYYPPKTATSYNITILDDASLAPIGQDLPISIIAKKGTQDAPTDQSSSAGFTVYVVEGQSSSKPPAPASITVGDVVKGGTVLITWSAVSIATSYTLRRVINGGTYADIYTGSALSYTDTVKDTWDNVQYLVRAYANGTSSSWTSSEVKTVQGGAVEPPTPSAAGARLEQFQNSDGTDIYPRTIVEGVFRKSDEKSLSNILNDIETNARKNVVTCEGGAEIVLDGDFGSPPYTIKITDEGESGGGTPIVPEPDLEPEPELEWIETTLPSTANWFSVTYGNGKFVAVAFNSNQAAYSTDGINWTAATLPASDAWKGVAYGNGKFVAVAGNGSNRAAYSTDGITWKSATLPSASYWQDVTYGNGKFVAVSTNDGKAAYSTNGINWTAATMPSSSSWYSVTYGNGKFVTVPWGSDEAAYSTDGINWTSATLPYSGPWASVTYGNEKFVAIVNSMNYVAYSTDGINWTLVTLPEYAYWNGVAYGDEKFVAVSTTGSDIAAWSSDGINWNSTTMPSVGSWTSVTYGNGKFVTIAYNSNKAAYAVSNSASAAMTFSARTTSETSSNSSAIYVNGKKISSTGETGPQGPQGPQGIQGVQGIQGPQGIQGQKGDPGEPFSVAKVYASVAAMNADFSSSSVSVGQFVIINTGNVEDEDNAKLYVKAQTGFSFITDLSGAQGMQGPKGDTGPQGIQGPQGPAGQNGTNGSAGAQGAAGANATINGVNALTINGGSDVTASQSGSTLTLGLGNSGVAANTYGPFLNGICWMANNGGIKSTTATLTLTAKKAGKFRFLYAGGGEENYDYMTVTVNGTSLLNTKGVTSPYGGYIETTIASGDVVVFSHIEDSSNFYDGDYAGIGNLALGNTDTQFDAITPENIGTYFTVSNGTYTFTPMVVFTGGTITVDAKGRITDARNVYPVIYSLDVWKTVTGTGGSSISTPVSVANGGTGQSSLTSGAALVGNGTGAVSTRSITNNTATTTAITASTNLLTMNTLRYALNRTTGPGSADTNYSTAMMRAIYAGTSSLTAGSSSLTSGVIYLVYE